jgi:hypothetical protein
MKATLQIVWMRRRVKITLKCDKVKDVNQRFLPIIPGELQKSLSMQKTRKICQVRRRKMNKKRPKG